MEKNIKIKEMEIRTGLVLAGYTMSRVAAELGVSKSHVRGVIQGKGQSKRVSDFIREKAVPVLISILEN